VIKFLYEKNTFASSPAMWSLDLDRLAKFAPGGLGAIAIETGTCRGNGTRMLASKFKRVITIELSEELLRNARERLSGAEYSHIEFFTGNSAEMLKTILSGLASSQPTFFFLDAHWSGDSSVEWEKSAWKGYGLDTAHLGEGTKPSGPEQCPLADELSVINEYCKGPAFILVDDMKNIPNSGSGLKNNGFPGEDWSHLSRQSLVDIVKSRLENQSYLEDPAQLFLSLKTLK
jgi:hypothetical protein